MFSLDDNESFVDDDMFALDDSQLLSPTPLEQQCNPIEDHLIKELTHVEDRIGKAKNDIAELQDTTKRVLSSLEKAAYGEHSSSDSDSDLYTVKGEPAVKRKRNAASLRFAGLELQSRWQRVIGDKWVIGTKLRNKSRRILRNPRIYLQLKNTTEMQGRSTFWHLVGAHWERIDEIVSLEQVAATIVLDVPSFEVASSVESFGTIVYERDDRFLQTVVPLDRLNAMDTLNSVAVDFVEGKDESVLALKMISVERNLIVGRRNVEPSLLAYLQRLYFTKVAHGVYVMMSPGSLNFCVAEIFSGADIDAVRLRVSARSLAQLNVMLRLLRDEFPEVQTEEEDDKCIGAAKALLEELEAYLNDKSPSEIQRRRIRSDLLIP